MPTFTNQARLSYNGVITNSNVATGEIVEVLSVTKTATPDNYVSGDVITYVVNLVNSGTTAYVGLNVTDNLGAYVYGGTAGTTQTLYPLTYVPISVRYFQNGVLQTTPQTVEDDGLAIVGITVPAGGTTTLVYQATVNEYAPLSTQSTITNTVTVSGSQLGTPITASCVLPVRNEPYLTIFKSISPNPVPENGRVTYTFDIQNLGNVGTSANDNVQVLDTFLPILSDITVTYNGATLPATSYSYNENTGVFSTNPGVISVPAATYVQNGTTGAWTVTPGTATLTITGGL